MNSAMIASIIRTRLTAQIADRSDFTCEFGWIIEEQLGHELTKYPVNTIDFIIWCA